VLLLSAAVMLAGTAAHAEPLTDLSQAYQALVAGRYADVEDLYARLHREHGRTPEGTYAWEEFNWKVYWASSSKPDEPDYWPKVDAATKAWVAHSPKSYVAAMTRAFALAYRSGSVQAREGAWVEADRLAQEARKLMDNSRRAGASDPLWHAVRLRVASVEGLPRTDVVNLIHAALAVDSTVMRVYQEAAIALSPNGRNNDDMVWLMRLALQRAGQREGPAIYARVLEATYWHFEPDGLTFGRNGLDWPLLDKSFADWKRRYPASYPLDLHAGLACSARDRETASRLLAEPSAGSRSDVWTLLGGKNYLSACREWLKPALAKPIV